MTDPFASYEKSIAAQAQSLRECRKECESVERDLYVERNENRRLRDACRQTNKGIQRLRARCDRQAKKIAELKSIVREAMSRVDYEYPQHWVEAVEGRRPAEKAT